jgi:hypothetical protein
MLGFVAVVAVIVWILLCVYWTYVEYERRKIRQREFEDRCREKGVRPQDVTALDTWAVVEFPELLGEDPPKK